MARSSRSPIGSLHDLSAGSPLRPPAVIAHEHGGNSGQFGGQFTYSSGPFDDLTGRFLANALTLSADHPDYTTLHIRIDSAHWQDMEMDIRQNWYIVLGFGIANNDTGDTPLNFSYTTSAGDLATGITVSAGTSPSASWTYGYDADNRLRSATEAGTVNAAARAFQASYNALNQIAQLNGTGYSYDADGELTGDGVNTYTWDAAHRLASVTSIASGDETSYRYDGLGRRIAITAHAQSAQPVTRYYLWCDAGICQERDNGNNVTAQYFAEGEEQDGQPLLYARDRLGSVVNLVDGSSGAVVAAYT